MKPWLTAASVLLAACTMSPEPRPREGGLTVDARDGGPSGSPADGGVPGHDPDFDPDVDPAPIPTPGPAPDPQPPVVRPPTTEEILQRAPERAWPPLQTELPEYELLIAESDLVLLEENLRDRDFSVPGRFAANGRTWHVEVEYRGRSARDAPKKSFQVKFPESDPFEGRKRLELIAEWRDGGYLAEKLWYDLCAAVGLRVPVARYVSLEVNGSYYGVMVDLEAIQKPFLKAHGFDHDADIYRCGMYDCELREQPVSFQRPWTKRTNEREPWDELWAFLQRVNRTPTHGFRAMLERDFDLEPYLLWLAVDTVIGNNMVGDSRSFLVFDKDRRRWTYVPWDLNNAVSRYYRKWGPDEAPKIDRALFNFTPYDSYAYVLAAERALHDPPHTVTWSVLATRVLDDEVLRARYLELVKLLLDTRFREEEIGPRVDRTQALLAPYIEREPYDEGGFAENSAEHMRDYVSGRREWLASHLEEIELHGTTPLRIDRVGMDAQGHPFVEIYNAGSSSESLSGLYLTGFARDPTQARLPNLTVPARGKVRLADDGSADASLPIELDAVRPEVAIFDSDGRTCLDLFYGTPLRPGSAYGRSPRGSETFAPIDVP